jgi:uncharacterized protein with NRDE domain
MPIRARVALALAAGEHSLPVLDDFAAVHTAASVALADGWRWTAGEAIAPRDLYAHVHRLLSLERDVAAHERARSALYALVDALYYTTWQAQKSAASESDRRLPNDMAEIGEDSLSAALAHAADATGASDWQAPAIQRLAAANAEKGPEDLGVRVQRTLVTD